MARYWFRPKKLGYGATAVTWEGWLLTIGSLAVFFGSLVAMNQWIDRANIFAWIIWASCVAVGVGLLVLISRDKTDGEWRWRG